MEQTVSVDNAQIPCFTLQLLIENAIKHGAAPKIGTTTIRILALQERDRVKIQVSDDGVGMPKDTLDAHPGKGLRTEESYRPPQYSLCFEVLVAR